MYDIVLFIHSWLRWILLLVSMIVISRSAYGWANATEYSRSDSRLSAVFAGLIDLQLLLGLVLYITLSPYTLTAFGNIGNAMKDPVLRFWLVEHFIIMVIAVTLVHIGNSRVRKAGNEALKFKRQFIFYLIALILILSRIPWTEPARMFRGIAG